MGGSLRDLTQEDGTPGPPGHRKAGVRRARLAGVNIAPPGTGGGALLVQCAD